MHFDACQFDYLAIVCTKNLVESTVLFLQITPHTIVRFLIDTAKPQAASPNIIELCLLFSIKGYINQFIKYISGSRVKRSMLLKNAKVFVT